jgi:hypothetical protein
VNGFLDAQGEPGTLTASAYRPALFTMVGVLAVGFVANLLVRPVAARFHESPVTPESAVAEPTGWVAQAGAAAGQGGKGSAVATSSPRLIGSWLLIAILLGYGVEQTLVTAAKIFTG